MFSDRCSVGVQTHWWIKRRESGDFVCELSLAWRSCRCHYFCRIREFCSPIMHVRLRRVQEKRRPALNAGRL
ncbi:hypothetical protein RRSWK_05030 [Rhodopirellula sp. SWK7]|nr:hypothetical protein RRSWK_05030 [Rhodopirellula sp. SWK7]